MNPVLKILLYMVVPQMRIHCELKPSQLHLLVAILKSNYLSIIPSLICFLDKEYSSCPTPRHAKEAVGFYLQLPFFQIEFNY